MDLQGFQANIARQEINGMKTSSAFVLSKGEKSFEIIKTTTKFCSKRGKLRHLQSRKLVLSPFVEIVDWSMVMIS